MLSDSNKKMTAKQIMSGSMPKCRNPYAIFNWSHAGSLLNRYSRDIIQISVDEFPDTFKGLHPIKYLEGVIKQAIIRHPEISAASEINQEKALHIRSIVKGLFSEEDID